MKQEHHIVAQVRSAQQSARAADELVEQYLPFIRSETAKFLAPAPLEGQDDALSIAMFAFYEAAMAYRPERGAFLPLAAGAIRNRLIDALRKERRHRGIVSLDAPAGEGEDDTPLLERLDTGVDPIEDHTHRTATREEIAHFADTLAHHGLTLSEVADNCPKQGRSMAVCHAALDRAKADPALLAEVERTGRLPLKALSGGSLPARKTLERHRTYMLAILLAYTNGFEIIRGHLTQVGRGKGGENR